MKLRFTPRLLPRALLSLSSSSSSSSTSDHLCKRNEERESQSRENLKMEGGGGGGGGGGGEEGGIERAVDSKDLQQQSKAFDKLTDRVEDRQLDSTRVQEVNFHNTFSFALI